MSGIGRGQKYVLRSTAPQAVSFDEWMRQVDAVIGSKLGLCSADLSDYAYRDRYAEGMSAACAARAAMHAEMDG